MDESQIWEKTAVSTCHSTVVRDEREQQAASQQHAARACKCPACGCGGSSFRRRKKAPKASVTEGFISPSTLGVGLCTYRYVAGGNKYFPDAPTRFLFFARASPALLTPAIPQEQGLPVTLFSRSRSAIRARANLQAQNETENGRIGVEQRLRQH